MNTSRKSQEVVVPKLMWGILRNNRIYEVYPTLRLAKDIYHLYSVRSKKDWRIARVTVAVK